MLGNSLLLCTVLGLQLPRLKTVVLHSPTQEGSVSSVGLQLGVQVLLDDLPEVVFFTGAWGTVKTVVMVSETLAVRICCCRKPYIGLPKTWTESGRTGSASRRILTRTQVGHPPTRLHPPRHQLQLSGHPWVHFADFGLSFPFPGFSCTEDIQRLAVVQELSLDIPCMWWLRQLCGIATNVFDGDLAHYWDPVQFRNAVI